MKRPWTMGEVRQLAALRERGLTLAAAALRLGRTRGAAQDVVHRFRLTVMVKYPAGYTRAAIRRLHAAGMTDERMGIELGRTRRYVKEVRLRLGLPANRPANRSRRPRCWGCGKLCPMPSKISAVGWEVRVVEFGNRQVSCPECYAAYGWGDLSREGNDALSESKAG